MSDQPALVTNAGGNSSSFRWEVALKFFTPIVVILTFIYQFGFRSRNEDLLAVQLAEQKQLIQNMSTQMQQMHDDLTQMKIKMEYMERNRDIDSQMKGKR